MGLLLPDAANGAFLAAGLAQRAWVEARLSDWLQLAPGLGVRPELRPRLLLVARELPRSLCTAAREADAEGIRLARFAPDAEAPAGFRLERVEPPPRPRRTRTAAPAPASRFRTGLGEDDLDLSGEERSSLV